MFKEKYLFPKLGLKPKSQKKSLQNSRTENGFFELISFFIVKNIFARSFVFDLLLGNGSTSSTHDFFFNLLIIFELFLFQHLLQTIFFVHLQLLQSLQLQFHITLLQFFCSLTTFYWKHLISSKTSDWWSKFCIRYLGLQKLFSFFDKSLA